VSRAFHLTSFAPIRCASDSMAVRIERQNK